MRKFKHLKFLNKYINGTQGVISLFLAMLMVPFVTIAGALINAGRINSAVAIFDEALCNASNSALGTYDDFLRDRFGLMAMSQDSSDASFNSGLVGNSYTADKFIDDLFKYYMEKNLGTLSNTYETTNLEGIGLYPLSDQGVLLSSVMQAGKITVPTQLVVDWGNIDDMISNFTKVSPLLKSMTQMAKTAADSASNFDSLLQAQDSLETAIETSDKLRSEYDLAHTDFVKKAAAFNTLVDNINAALQNVDYWQSVVDASAADKQDLENDIKELRDEKKEAETKEEKDAIQEEIDALNEDLQFYRQQETELSIAKSTLNSYKNQYAETQQNAVNAKNTYYSKIIALRNQIEITGDAAVSFKAALNKTIQDGKKIMEGVIKTGISSAQTENDKRIKELQAQNEDARYTATLAQNSGNTAYVNTYHQHIQENNSEIIRINEDKQKLGNINTVINSSSSAIDKQYNQLTSLGGSDLQGQYEAIYNALDACAVNVSAITIPSDYSNFSYVYKEIYCVVDNPIELDDVSNLIEAMEEEADKSSEWSILKVMMDFVVALINIKSFADPDLNVTIDTSKFPSTLPSKTTHSFASPYDKQDQAQSQAYKDLLNSYTEVDIVSDINEVGAITDDITAKIKELGDYTKQFKFRNIPKIAYCAGDLAGLLLKLGAYVVNDQLNLKELFISRFLLTGYVSYNTANRTTYKGSALTGASFGLPATAGMSKNLAFVGAETEYIFCGKTSETSNQTFVFILMSLIRSFANLPAATRDPIVQTLSTAVGAATLGALGFLPLLIVVLLEGFLDTLILANGGNVSFIKSSIYMSPAGILPFMGKVLKLSIPDSLRQKIYEYSCNVSSKINEDQDLPSYADYKKGLNSKGERVKTAKYDVDYTKMLQLMMLILISKEKMVRRLGDIVQMEASYKAATEDVSSYEFDLTKSYTYIRASGSFTSDTFIKIGDRESLRSETRVIYKGY